VARRTPPAAEAPTTTSASPRDACAGRSQFSLYRCMQAQCVQSMWIHHPQCARLRATDSVD
jgi:non-specific serine/threonine protein kinase